MFWGSPKIERQGRQECTRVDEQIRNLNEYVYLKYVDGARVEDIDEPAAAEQLEGFYSRPENVNDGECVYLGILTFELGYEIEERQEEFFRRSKKWLDRHKAFSFLFMAFLG